jgi:hypothetical protein
MDRVAEEERVGLPGQRAGQLGGAALEKADLHAHAGQAPLGLGEGLGRGVHRDDRRVEAPAAERLDYQHGHRAGAAAQVDDGHGPRGGDGEPADALLHQRPVHRLVEAMAGERLVRVGLMLAAGGH